jgi:hypothetical protein
MSGRPADLEGVEAGEASTSISSSSRRHSVDEFDLDLEVAREPGLDIGPVGGGGGGSICGGSWKEGGGDENSRSAVCKSKFKLSIPKVE